MIFTSVHVFVTKSTKSSMLMNSTNSSPRLIEFLDLKMPFCYVLLLCGSLCLYSYPRLIQFVDLAMPFCYVLLLGGSLCFHEVKLFCLYNEDHSSEEHSGSETSEDVVVYKEPSTYDNLLVALGSSSKSMADVYKRR